MRTNTEVTFHGSTWGAPPIPKKRMTSSPPLEEESPKSVNRKPNLGEILRTFGENTTAHGIPTITRSKRTVSKILWLAAFMSLLGVFCFQGTNVIIDYIGYPSTTKVELVTGMNLNFPSVTICNMNRFRRSKLVGTRFEGLIHLDGGLVGDDGKDDYDWFFDWDSEWYNKYMLQYDEETSFNEYADVTSYSGSFASGTAESTTATNSGSGQTQEITSEEEGIATISLSSSSTPQHISDSTWLINTGESLYEDLAETISVSTAQPETTASTIATDGTTPNMIITALSEGDDSATTITSGSSTGITTTTSLSSSNTPQHTSAMATTSSSVTTPTTPSTTTITSGSGTSQETISQEGGTATTTLSSFSTQSNNIAVTTKEVETTSSSAATSSSTTPLQTTVTTMTSTIAATAITTTGSSTHTQFGTTTKEEMAPLPTTDAGTKRRRKRAVRIIRETNDEQLFQNTYEQNDFHYKEYYDWGTLTDPNDWQKLYELSKSPDYSDFLDIINPTRSELKELGHQAKDLILQCTFDKRSCSYKDFHGFQNQEYGNCFTFNYESTINNTRNSGAQFGLHLTLSIEVPEYVGILSPEDGIRVSIHPHTVPPFPEDDGITIAPGMATNIGIRQIYIQRKGEPYNAECHSVTSDIYSRKSCYKICIQEEMYKRCQCVTDILLENRTKCNYLNETQQQCKQLIEYLGEEDKLDCTCPIACNETSYTKSVSASHWPSERYEEHLQRRLSEDPDSAFAAKIAKTDESTRKNLVRLRVYFEELNYQSIKESPLHTFPSLLGNLGGLLGLYIGVSFLTLCEVATLLFDIIKYILRKVLCKREVAPSPILLE